MITDAYVVQEATVSTIADSNGWYTYACAGYRSNDDTTRSLVDFKVGTTVSYRAGYKYFASGTQATSLSESAVLDSVLTYVIQDSAVLLLSAASAAVSMLIF